MAEGDIQIKVEPIREYPKLEDMVGWPREFGENFIRDIKGEDMYRTMGVEPDSVYLLEGKPGTGKTMCINAVYNTINGDVYDKLKKRIEEQYMLEEENEEEGEDVIEMEDSEPVSKKKKNTLLLPEELELALFRYDIGKYGTAYINRGCKIAQNFFNFAGLYASIGIRTLIEIDEAESLLGKRGGSNSHKEDDKLLTTIMKNLQSVHDTPKMYVVLMSNLPEACDEASLRAGRVDRKYEFELPKQDEREQAFSHFINQVNNNAGYAVIRGYDSKELSKISDGFNYADIRNSVDSAVKNRASEVLDDKSDKLIAAPFIKGKRLEKAVLTHKNKFHKKDGIKGFGK